MSDTETKILDIFSAVREDNSLPYENKNFMEFLIKPNGKNLDNSFKGKIHKNRFLERIQEEFRVCFPNDFFEKKWSLINLAGYIENRQKQGQANLKMVEKRLKTAKQIDNIMIFANLFTFPPLIALNSIYFWLYFTLFCSLNAFLIYMKYNEVVFYRKLLNNINNIL
jgi:hypothetical protein